jgi:putative hydrolase of the HAD superfamily
MSRIKLLTFDLDDTLWDVEALVRRADRDMMDWLAVHYPQLVAQFDPVAFFTLRKQVWVENPDIRHNLAELRLRTLALALRQSGHSDAEAEQGSKAAFDVFFQSRNRVEFFPDVMPTLEALRRDYTLYALSNGGADIAHMGLSHIFSLHLSAASVGAAKPDPAMFLKALEHARVEPQEVIHIGDHPEQDIEAAQKLGMNTVWVNIKGATWPLDVKPDAQISKIGELASCITHLQGKP